MEIETEKEKFGPNWEAAVISLIFDQPEFITTILNYIDDDFFNEFSCKWVFTIVKFHWLKHNIIASRTILLDTAVKNLTSDDPHEEIIKLIKRESDPREVPIVKADLINWAKKKAFSKLYTEEAIDAHQNGDYEQITKIIEDASKISEFNSSFYFLLDQVDSLFVPDVGEKFTTGFPRLDAYLNSGGPTRGDCLSWMAPTGVGKSLIIVNSCAANAMRNKNVLYVTCEMSKEDTGLRFMGCISEEWIRARFVNDKQEKIKQRMENFKANYGNRIVIVEYPPNEISVDVIHANCDMLRKMYGFNPDVIAVDYLELLLPRQQRASDNEYGIQKRIATELCRLAVKENAFVITATQTNRDGNENLNSPSENRVIDLNKVAESYGKTMPMAYLISINQNKQEYDDGKETEAEACHRKSMGLAIDLETAITKAQCRFYIAKNRKGPKFKMVNARINYETMKASEID